MTTQNRQKSKVKKTNLQYSETLKFERTLLLQSIVLRTISLSHHGLFQIPDYLILEVCFFSSLSFSSNPEFYLWESVPLLAEKFRLSVDVCL